MQNGTEKIVVLVVLGSLFTIGLTLFATAFFQRRLRRQLQSVAMREAYQQELLRSQLEVQEQAIQTVGRALHDNLGQVLSLIKINLNTLTNSLDQPASEKLLRTKDLVNQAIADVRSLSKSLTADNRLGAGLAAAIGQELDAVRKTGVVETAFYQRGDEQRLDPQQKLILFRIVQESLQNALKHAQAKNITVSLDYSAGGLTLTVADDGVGFDPEKIAPQSGGEHGSGLANIQNRARLIGAEATIRSAVGRGTTTTLILPCPPNTTR